MRNENSLFMNSSVAFGSRDLDDFLLQSGDISVMSDLFHNQRKKNNGVNKGSGRKEEGKDEKDMVRGNEVEETKDIGYSDAVEEVRDREISADCRRVRDSDMLANTVESSPSIDCQNCIETQVQGPESSYVGKVDEVDLDLLAKEVPRNMGLDVNDGGCMEKKVLSGDPRIWWSHFYFFSFSINRSFLLFSSKNLFARTTESPSMPSSLFQFTIFG